MEEKELHIPKGACIPRNQVAGHKHEGRSKLGKPFLVLPCLFKPYVAKRSLTLNLIHLNISRKYFKIYFFILP